MTILQNNIDNNLDVHLFVMQTMIGENRQTTDKKMKSYDS